MATIVAPKLTYEDLRQMPNDGKRYELIDGEVFMTPSPNTEHQLVVGNLHVLLREFLAKNDAGKVLLAPYDVVFSDRNCLQPDLLVVRKQRLGAITEANLQGAPDLVIEVLSPSNAAFDRETKVQVYGRFGVPEVWYVDPSNDTVQILNLGPEGKYQLTASLGGEETLVSSILPGLRFPLGLVFVP